jgi:hypothetical protein
MAEAALAGAAVAPALTACTTAAGGKTTLTSHRVNASRMNEQSRSQDFTHGLRDAGGARSGRDLSRLLS